MDNQNPPNIENCGIYSGPGGSVTANKIKITINPPAGTEIAATTKSRFRFNIPTPTEHFKGRRKTLEVVRDYFHNLPVQSVNCWERIVAIVGLGGMGKTETAFKFAAEFEETFQNVAWINAETERNASASFLGLAKYLKLVPNDQIEADLELVRQVYRHIDEHDYGRTLFIFDNAIRLNSGEEEFGIYEYLPTDGLKNKRFPNILITTQTHDWERRIKTVQVDELSAEESLEFFRCTFHIQSTECDDLFKEFHDLFEGYPLVMNLAASQIDYSPKSGSVHQLTEQICSYIGKLKKEQSKLLNETFNRAWPTKYHKTLSNVWKLTFERIQQEDKGTKALEILQYMSFLHVPINSDDVARMLARSSECPLPPWDERRFQMKQLFRVLERFYIVKILNVKEFDVDYSCKVEIHRLVQFVVRQQMDSTEDLERFLLYFARDFTNSQIVNESALDEVLQRSQLSQRALPYVGILACMGHPAACKIVETRQHETKAAAIIQQLYYLKRGRKTLSENAIQILRELFRLTKSEERIQDRYFFIDITMNLLTVQGYLGYRNNDRFTVPGYFYLDSLNGVEELGAELVLNVLSERDLCCNCNSIDRINRSRGLSGMVLLLSKTFIQKDAPSSTLTAGVIADTWLALFDRMIYNIDFWKDMYKAFHSQNASQSRIALLRTCLWNRGLAMKLSAILEFVSCECQRDLNIILFHPFIVTIMDVCMDGVDLKDERVEQVLSSFCRMIATIEPTYITREYCFDEWAYFVVDSCSVWVKLFLMDGDPPSQKLLEHLSSLQFLDWLQRNLENDLRFIDHMFSDAMDRIPEKYPIEYFPKFIHRFSSSDIKVIQTLVDLCQRLDIRSQMSSPNWLPQLK